MEKDEKRFKYLEHTADLKFQSFGRTLDELYENSVYAIIDYVAHGQLIKGHKGRIIEVTGTDHESLLYNLIDEVIYLIEVEKFIISKINVQIRGFNLKAELFGDDIKNYELDQLKAATYAEMFIKKTAEGWVAQAVVDI